MNQVEPERFTSTTCQDISECSFELTILQSSQILIACHSNDPYSHPRESGLPPRPRIDYNDRDAYHDDRDSRGYDNRDDYYRGGGYNGGGGQRARTWDDEARDHKRGRYEVSIDALCSVVY